ncbi:histone-lysine N-methyltransferase PR-Set7 isoform X1 [Stomoxys calcitrans]|uniref:histone-lysine N-methyltransferase PR-Set7 isoform X1 n=2 Tax=Stomoxys calcitrans TaxID=35570 RepID=UPI0027E398DE|nr:histone-lysine N-methyltransferase PR-Set7 isoform X1 [Stomoxys calcitrans]XP_059220015.1 histone-lysine N-methyltransferase PR-Set7 isoform X1 [Stomoxys calcitrans]
MVRRRTRACANSKAPVELMSNGGSAAAVLASAAQLLEDQYFASPKRKDCKVEESAAAAAGGVDDTGDHSSNASSGGSSPATVQAEDAVALRTKLKAISPSKAKGGINGRTIGVPLATRSQTRTIENFFKASAAAKQNKITNYMQGAVGGDCDDWTNAAETQKIIQQPMLSASVTPPHMNKLQEHIEQQNRQIHGDHNYQQPHQLPMVISRRSLDHVFVPQEFIFDLSEDTNDSQQTDISEEAPLLHIDSVHTSAAVVITNGFDFTTHRSSQRSDSHSSSHSSSNTSGTENIFLQEPVLTLNVDKSPNQASSIKINKTLEVLPKFSSPNKASSLLTTQSLDMQPKFPSPTSLTAAVLHRRFNQVVTMNTSPCKTDPYVSYERKHLELNCHDYAMMMMPENDNSSCDSGVAFHTTVTTTTTQSNDTATVEAAAHVASPAAAVAANRRRKPATPHRIVCPSPIKAPERVISPASSPSPRKMASALSPRKSQRHVTTTAMAAAGGGAAAFMPVTNKTRRRLNVSPQKEQQSALEDDQGNHLVNGLAIEQDDDAVVVLVDDEVEVDDDHDIECENMTSNATDMKFTHPSQINGVTKSILNSAKHPTNQQNATNNKGRPKGHHKTKYTVQRPHHAALKHQAPQPLAATNGNREVLPVRRSVRKTKTAVKEEMMRNLEQAILEERCEGLKIALFEGKGRGIISERRFERGEFVIEYVGDLISTTEAAEREKRYALDENAGCYMYYFKHNNQQYCIDATEDTGKLGRLVNHSRNGNLMTKIVVVKQKPHLVLIAKDDIEAGEELCYDYGDRSKESLLHHPWLAF